MKIFYWSPFISEVATVSSVIRSAESILKYSKKEDNINIAIIDAIGEWKKFKDKLSQKKIDYSKLGWLDLSKYFPISGFIYSRFLSILLILYGRK